MADVALAPQVEFELLKGMQQQNTSWTRHLVVCTVFKEIVQFIARKLILDSWKTTNRFSQYLNIEFILCSGLSLACELIGYL